MTLANVKAKADSYQYGQGRPAQNSHQMYEFLYCSLNDDAQASVALRESDYLISQVGAPTIQYFNGPLYLKTIIGVAHIDTRSTAAHIRQSLAQLPTKIASLDYDIETFNRYVRLQRGALEARGETSSDLLVNVFAALGIVPDATFKAYIDRIKDDYDDGDERVTVNYLMEKAEIKSKVLIRENKYIMPTKADEKILALSAEFDKVLAQNTELSKQLTNKRKPSSEDPQSGGGGDRQPRPNTGEWAWKNVAPAAGAPTQKKVKTKNYYWCPKHLAWTLHKPDACRLETAVPPAPAATPPAPAGQIAQALSAIADEAGNIFHDMD